MAGGLQISTPFKHRAIHGKIMTPEMSDKEMNNEYMSQGQNRLNPVYPECQNQAPSRDDAT